MAESVKVEEVADAMFRIIKEGQGLKKYKATDLQKEMIEKFGADRCNKDLCKKAIRILIESERCVYTYFGGSFIEIPHREAAAND
ncbi:MAG: hypothetical protein HW421_3140 [Ignavibacteria bacterium]|nr:hypothetical protein [Ignavibacteria bacterium]